MESRHAKEWFRLRVAAGAACLALLGAPLGLAAPPPVIPDTPELPVTEPCAPAAGNPNPCGATLPPQDAAQRADETTEAGQFADQLLQGGPQLDVQAGGEKGLGTATLNGKKIDVARLIPTTEDTSYINRLQETNNHRDLLGLKQMYDEEAATDSSNSGVTGKAAVSVNNTAANRTYTSRNIIPDTTLGTSMMIIDQSKDGNVLGQTFGNCSTETTSTPSKGAVHDLRTCNKVLIPGGGAPVCTRTRVGSAEWTILDGSKDAALGVEPGSNRNVCSRQTSVTKTPQFNDQAKDAELNMTVEQGGASCTREISASVHAVNAPGSAQGDLPIDTQTPGLSCTRTVTVSGEGASTKSFNYSLLPIHPPVPDLRVGLTPTPPASVTTLSAFSISGWFDPKPLIKQVPSKANGWIAIFDARCYRNDFPNGICPLATFTLHWSYSDPGNAKAAVADSGNCGDGGTPQCPAKWACTASAPTTWNGKDVTTALAQSVAPLYPGAPNTCAVAKLSRVCSGPVNSDSTIAIGPYLPPGITAVTAPESLPQQLLDGILPKAYAAAGDTSFSGFTWTVTNPQPEVTVALTQTPSAANGWKAGFRVTRTNYSYVPQKPHVVMNWTVSTETVQYGKADAGNCSDPGSALCPTQWSCIANAPTTSNGYPISTETAAQFAPLFPGASATCVAGKLSRVCSGSSNVSSTVGIGDIVPPDVVALTNFQWSVTNPDPRVSVTLVSAPTFANGWTATFDVKRQMDNGAAPPKPKMHLTWTVQRPDRIDIGYDDTGNCGLTPDGAFCKTEWTCTSNAPQVINGTTVTAPNPNPLFPGANATCLSGKMDMVCSGDGAHTTAVSIAELIYEGDTEITDYAWTETIPVPGVTVTQVQVPALANDWVAIFKTTHDTWANAPAGEPVVHLSWKMRGAPQYAFNIIEDGDCGRQSDDFCKIVWKCNESAPVTLANGIVVPPEVVQQQPELFGGDGGACMKAQLNLDCTGVWNGQGGQVCWTNEDGSTQCTDVPQSNSPPDSCQDLEADNSCLLKSSDCAGGATDVSGFCYVRTYVYDCVTEVEVPNGNVTKKTTCTGVQPCLDGTCSPPSKVEQQSDRADSIAKQVIAQTILSDWTIEADPSPAPPSGGNNPPPGNVDEVPQDP